MKKKGVYHHGDLRAALLAGVAEIIKEQGVSNVSLREVARRIGVSHGAPAHHFASKQALLTAFATEGFARMGKYALEAMSTSVIKHSRERLSALGRGYVAFAVDYPEYFEVMYRGDLIDTKDPAFAAASDAVFGMLQQTVATMAQDGELGGVDPLVLSVAAWSLAHGFAGLVISKRLTERTGVTEPSALSASVMKLFVDSVLGGKPKGKK